MGSTTCLAGLQSSRPGSMANVARPCHDLGTATIWEPVRQLQDERVVTPTARPGIITPVDLGRAFSSSTQ
ncbi:MAG: hypothetical protein ABL886_09445, partial [Rhodoglobus sp.]